MQAMLNRYVQIQAPELAKRDIALNAANPGWCR